MRDTVHVFDYKVFCDCLSDLKLFVNRPVCINTINAYSYVIAKKDDRFKNALQSSDILLPDGFPITFAALLLKGRRINKIAGEDIFFYLVNHMNQRKGRVFFLGASESTLSKITSRLQLEFSSITVGSYSPPYKKEFSEKDNEKMIEEINLFSPEVLFVGMTAPKQEKWVHQFKDRINADVICSIGAVFDFYAQTIERPSAFWINLHLEWFIRLIREPRRLWRRYLWYSPQFIVDVFKLKISLLFSKGG